MVNNPPKTTINMYTATYAKYGAIPITIAKYIVSKVRTLVLTSTIILNNNSLEYIALFIGKKSP